MTDTFTDAFDDLHDAIPSARVQLRINNAVLERGLSSGLDRARQYTDQGGFREIDGTVKFKASDKPQEWPSEIEGEKVDLSFDAGSTWSTYRIASSRLSAGIMTISLFSEVTNQ